MRRDSSRLRWRGPRPGPNTVDPRPRAGRSGHRSRLRHDGTVGRTASVRPRRLASRRHPGGVCSHRGTQPRAAAGRRRLHGGREPANLGPHRVAGTVPARPPSGGAERPRVVRTSRQMFSEIGREPTPEELANKLHMPLEKVRKTLKIAKEPLSLETPIGEQDDSHLGDLIEDKNAILPIDATIQSNLRETTTRVLASLTPREERIVRMRFGLGMNSDHTLEEVGQQFSVTRERIRQIEAKAIRKLKHPSRSRALRSFLDN